MNTHPEFLEFVGEQIKEKRRIIEFLVASNDKRVEADLSAWLAIHDGLEMEKIPNAHNVSEYAVGYNEMLEMLQERITKHLDTVMEQG